MTVVNIEFIGIHYMQHYCPQNQNPSQKLFNAVICYRTTIFVCVFITRQNPISFFLEHNNIIKKLIINNTKPNGPLPRQFRTCKKFTRGKKKGRKCFEKK